MKLLAPLAQAESGTFTRASTGSYFDAAGVLRTAAVNARRISHDPTPRLHVEAAATNLVPNSEGLDSGYWWGTATAGSPDTAHGISLYRVQDTSETVQQSRISGITVADDNAVYAVSIYLKRYGTDNDTQINLQFYYGTTPSTTAFFVNFATKTVQLTAGPGTLLAFREITTGLFRLEVSVANNATGNTSLSAQVYPAISAVGGLTSVYAGGLQIEAGGMATSYIKTTSGAVTRAADVNTATLYSSAPEPAATETEWSAATAYTVGQRCILVATHKQYECLVANTNYIPSANLAGAAPKWLLVGATNKWSMFDEVWGSQTSIASPLTVCLTPGVVVDSLILMNFSASRITVTMNTSAWGLVYEKTVYPAYATDYAFTDLPAFAGATLTVNIECSWGPAKCGKLAIGTKAELGEAQYGATAGITDYSTKNVDTFGNATIVRRKYAKRLTVKLVVANTDVDRIFYYLAAYRSYPLVWIGADNLYGALIVYGYYRDFEVDVAYAKESYCSLTIEGLT